jgi:hypothetical protein
VRIVGLPRPAQQQEHTIVDICHRLLTLQNQDIKGLFTRLVTSDKPLLHYHTEPEETVTAIDMPWKSMTLRISYGTFCGEANGHSFVEQNL